MKQVAKENYGNSFHFWYQVDLLTDHDYGKIFNTDLASLEQVKEVILADLSEAQTDQVYFWYFGQSLEETVLMIKVVNQQVDAQINLKDFDFALNWDAIKDWKHSLANSLLN
ncbi:hypothetical protein ACVRZD_04205 [Streptococcus hongkongensis]|nr:hypothetical protein NC01_01305 [Streptococcus uberis]